MIYMIRSLIPSTLQLQPKEQPKSREKVEVQKDPEIPDPDVGDMDVFRAQETPDWAKDAESVHEELQESFEEDKEFWEYYDDPLNNELLQVLDRKASDC